MGATGLELFTNRKNGIRLIEDIQAQLADKATADRIARDVRSFLDRNSVEDILAGVAAREAGNDKVIEGWQSIAPILQVVRGASQQQISSYLSRIAAAMPAEAMYDSLSRTLKETSFEAPSALTEIYLSLATDLPGFIKQNLDLVEKDSPIAQKTVPPKKPKGFHL